MSRRTGEFLIGRLEGTTLPFRYREEAPSNYQRYNSFIQGVEFVKSTATIFTSTELGFKVGDMVTLDRGQNFKIVSITPQIKRSRSMYARDYVEGYIIALE